MAPDTASGQLDVVCVYSVRAKERPTVSTPIAWAELEEAIGAGDPGRLVFEMGDVLERLEEHGDLFEPLAQPGSAP